MTPQQLAIAASLISFLASFAVKQKWITQDTYDWLVSSDTLQAVGIIGGGAIAIYGLYVSRKHGLIKSTAALPQVDAVITKQKTADEIPAVNVVGSVADAEKVVPHRPSKVKLDVKHVPVGQG